MTVEIIPVQLEAEIIAGDDLTGAHDDLPAEMAFPGQELVLRAWAARHEQP